MYFILIHLQEVSFIGYKTNKNEKGHQIMKRKKWPATKIIKY